MKTIATPHTNAAEFLQALDKLQFIPAKWDSPNDRLLDRKNKDGHTELRIHIAYEGEQRPHNISLVKLDGTKAQLIEWESNHMSAHMPMVGLLALIKCAG